jgi:N-acetylglucosamine kinase-like BadF-type ATPase
MSLVLGIDGGGTRTRASIADGERILARAENGSIKRLRVGAEAAEEHLRALLKDIYAVSAVWKRLVAAWPVRRCPASKSGFRQSLRILA